MGSIPPSKLGALGAATAGSVLVAFAFHRCLREKALASEAKQQDRPPPIIEAQDVLPAAEVATVQRPVEKPPEDPNAALRKEWARDLVVLANDGDAAGVSKLLANQPPESDASILDIRCGLPFGDCYPSVTAAYMAATKGHADILDVLLQAGAAPDIKCIKSTQWDGAFTLTENDTALLVACRESHTQCVEVLLRAGADPNVECDTEYLEGDVEWGEDDDGTEQLCYTCLDVAKSDGVLELLRKYDAEHTKKTGTKPKIKKTSGSRMGA